VVWDSTYYLASRGFSLEWLLTRLRSRSRLLSATYVTDKRRKRLRKRAKSHARESLCSHGTGYPRINEHVLLCVLVTGEVKRIGHFGLKFFSHACVCEKVNAEGLKTCRRIEKYHKTILVYIVDKHLTIEEVIIERTSNQRLDLLNIRNTSQNTDSGVNMGLSSSGGKYFAPQKEVENEILRRLV